MFATNSSANATVQRFRLRSTSEPPPSGPEPPPTPKAPERPASLPECSSTRTMRVTDRMIWRPLRIASIAPRRLAEPLAHAGRGTPLPAGTCRTPRSRCGRRARGSRLIFSWVRRWTVVEPAPPRLAPRRAQQRAADPGPPVGRGDRHVVDLEPLVGHVEHDQARDSPSRSTTNTSLAAHDLVVVVGHRPRLAADALDVRPVGRLHDLVDPRHVGRDRRPQLRSPGDRPDLDRRRPSARPGSARPARSRRRASRPRRTGSRRAPPSSPRTGRRW